MSDEFACEGEWEVQEQEKETEVKQTRSVYKTYNHTPHLIPIYHLGTILDFCSIIFLISFLNIPTPYLFSFPKKAELEMRLVG